LSAQGSIAGFAGRFSACSAKNGGLIVAGEWLGALKQVESKHNTAAALRERQNIRVVGPFEKPETPINPPSKTSNTPIGREAGSEKPKTPTSAPSETSKTIEAEDLGLVASWSVEFGFISMHDPTTGEWHDLRWKDAPGWARWEARKRKELYGDGNRKAHRLTSREIGEIWAAENPLSIEEGIVEDHPVEGEA
jgi:hypothetical protein